jgi:hypothetical protein
MERGVCFPLQYEYIISSRRLSHLCRIIANSTSLHNFKEERSILLYSQEKEEYAHCYGSFESAAVEKSV